MNAKERINEKIWSKRIRDGKAWPKKKKRKVLGYMIIKTTLNFHYFVLKQYSLAPVNRGRLLSQKNF